MKTNFAMLLYLTGCLSVLAGVTWCLPLCIVIGQFDHDHEWLVCACHCFDNQLSFIRVSGYIPGIGTPWSISDTFVSLVWFIVTGRKTVLLYTSFIWDLFYKIDITEPIMPTIWLRLYKHFLWRMLQWNVYIWSLRLTRTDQSVNGDAIQKYWGH